MRSASAATDVLLSDFNECSARKVKTERSGGLMDEGYVVCMEDLGGAYQRLANNKRVGKAVKAGARYNSVCIQRSQPEWFELIPTASTLILRFLMVYCCSSVTRKWVCMCLLAWHPSVVWANICSFLSRSFGQCGYYKARRIVWIQLESVLMLRSITDLAASWV